MSNIINIQKPKSIFSKKHKHFSKKIRLIIMALIILLIVAISYGVFIFMSLKSDEIVVVTPKDDITRIVKSDMSAVDVKSAQSELKELADKEPNTQNKLVYLFASADLYYNSADYENGIEIAKTIENLDSSAQSAGELAHGYEISGDYINAAKYYGIAADRSEKTTDTTKNTPYNDYLNLKKSAEAMIE